MKPDEPKPKFKTFEEAVDAALFGLNRLAGGTDAFDVKIVTEACKRFIYQHTGQSVGDDGKRLYKKSDIRAAWKRQRAICPECDGILIDPNLNSQVEESERTRGDHFIPHSRQGKTEIGNLRAVHHRCNSAKSDKEPIQNSKATGRTVLEMIQNTHAVDEGEREQ